MLTYSKKCGIISIKTQMKQKRCVNVRKEADKVKDEKTSAERLIEIIELMSSAEVDRLLSFAEGARFGEMMAAVKQSDGVAA